MHGTALLPLAAHEVRGRRLENRDEAAAPTGLGGELPVELDFFRVFVDPTPRPNPSDAAAARRAGCAAQGPP